MFAFGPIGLICMAIVGMGAYHVWLTVTHFVSKFFHQREEPHVKKYAGFIFFVTVMLMLAPLLIPTPFYIKDIVGLLYVVYVGTAFFQVWSWFHKDKNKPASKRRASVAPE